MTASEQPDPAIFLGSGDINDLTDAEFDAFRQFVLRDQERWIDGAVLDLMPEGAVAHEGHAGEGGARS